MLICQKPQLTLYFLISPDLTPPMLPKAATTDSIKQELSFDDKVKVAGFDVDGILRGK